MSTEQAIGDMLNDIRMIDQSRPEYLNGVADAWDKIGAGLDGHKQLVTRVLNHVADDWVSQRVKVMNYSGEVTGGMDALAAGITEVASALRGAVPHLQSLKSALTTAVTTLLLPGFDVLTMVNLVNEYHATMAALGGSLGRAQEKFNALAVLNSGGGIIPAPPELPPTPN